MYIEILKEQFMELREINKTNANINITDELESVMKINSEWSYLLFFECVELFEKSRFCVSYWKDEDNWMTLSDESNIIAYIWRGYPLIFLDEKFITVVKNMVSDKYDSVLISAPNLARNIFKIDGDFNLIDFDLGFNKKSFSAEDFWYHTNDSV
ncbi:Uncharacterised protein [Sphingobacterium spiritivorum]|nr:Uncharacterised protein [Sphingobacterium spiritivorum]